MEIRPLAFCAALATLLLTPVVTAGPSAVDEPRREIEGQAEDVLLTADRAFHDTLRRAGNLLDRLAGEYIEALQADAEEARADAEAIVPDAEGAVDDAVAVVEPFAEAATGLAGEAAAIVIAIVGDTSEAAGALSRMIWSQAEACAKNLYPPAECL